MSQIKIKICTGCGQEKLETVEFFSFRKDQNKFSARCKICVSNTKKKNYETNKEEIAKKSKEYYSNNLEKILKYKKDYYENNKEEKIIYNKKYREENREYLLEYSRGVYSQNRVERIEQSKQYYYDNKEVILEYKKEYRKENKDKISENAKIYYKENKEELSAKSKVRYIENRDIIIANSVEYKKNRRQNDPIFRYMETVSLSIFLMLKECGSSKNGVSCKMKLPFTDIELLNHLISQFSNPENLTPDGNIWMTLENNGVYNKKLWIEKDPNTWKWNIDHIIPQSKLKFDSYDHPNFLKCWSLENLRPLRADLNIKKGNRINY